jgi:hypothetical protein
MFDINVGKLATPAQFAPMPASLLRSLRSVAAKNFIEFVQSVSRFFVLQGVRRKTEN